MMEAAHSGKGDDPRSTARAWFHRSQLRRVLLKSEVASISRVVVHVFTKKAPEVPLMEDDHAIEQLPPAAADPALRHAILPGTAIGGALRLDP